MLSVLVLRVSSRFPPANCPASLAGSIHNFEEIVSVEAHDFFEILIRFETMMFSEPLQSLRFLIGNQWFKSREHCEDVSLVSGGKRGLHAVFGVCILYTIIDFSTIENYRVYQSGMWKAALHLQDVRRLMGE